MFDISYEALDGTRKLVWQNSWGLTTRSVSARTFTSAETLLMLNVETFPPWLGVSLAACRCLRNPPLTQGVLFGARLSKVGFSQIAAAGRNLLLVKPRHVIFRRWLSSVSPQCIPVLPHAARHNTGLPSKRSINLSIGDSSQTCALDSALRFVQCCGSRSAKEDRVEENPSNRVQKLSSN
jgi:hypothetical protein